MERFGQFFGISQKIPACGEFLPFFRAKLSPLQFRNRLGKSLGKQFLFFFIEVEPFPLFPLFAECTIRFPVCLKVQTGKAVQRRQMSFFIQELKSVVLPMDFEQVAPKLPELLCADRTSTNTTAALAVPCDPALDYKLIRVVIFIEFILPE